MTAQNAERFRWHSTSQLCVGEQSVAREMPVTAASHLIPATPVAQAAASLGQALLSGAGFCLHGAHPPALSPLKAGTFVTLTGGTSGAPKAILRQQSSWIASFRENAARFTLTPNDKAAVLGGLDHSLSLYGVVEALYLGLDAHVLSGLGAERQRTLIQNQGITVLYVTPTHVRLLAGRSKARLPSVRLILCGGGALDPQTRDRARDTFPNAELVVFYGAAETSFVTLSDQTTPDGSVGQAYPGVHIEIKDAKGRATSDPGEIWVKSPYLFDRYATGGTAETKWQDGMLSVGELGYKDAGGNLWITGRKDRAVNIADTLVSPEPVEQIIAALVPERASAVLPRLDPLRGNRLLAIIEGDAQPGLLEQIKRAVAAQIGRAAAPQDALFHPDWPRLASGKTDLVALAKWVEDQS